MNGLKVEVVQLSKTYIAPKIDLYNTDCIKAMSKIDKDMIDLIVTDPPYNLGNFMKNRDTNLKKMRDNFFGSAGWDDMEFDEWENSMDLFFKESARVIKNGGTMIVFMAIIKVETIIKLAENMAFITKLLEFGIKLILCHVT